MSFVNLGGFDPMTAANVFWARGRTPKLKPEVLRCEVWEANEIKHFLW